MGNITEINKVLTARLGIQNAQNRFIKHFQNSLKSRGQKSDFVVCIRFSCIFGKSSYKMASAISQLADRVRSSMLLNMVTFGYTEVYTANQMAGSCDVRYTLIHWP